MYDMVKIPAFSIIKKGYSEVFHWGLDFLRVYSYNRSYVFCGSHHHHYYLLAHPSSGVVSGEGGLHALMPRPKVFECQDDNIWCAFDVVSLLRHFRSGTVSPGRWKLFQRPSSIV